MILSHFHSIGRFLNLSLRIQKLIALSSSTWHLLTTNLVVNPHLIQPTIICVCEFWGFDHVSRRFWALPLRLLISKDLCCFYLWFWISHLVFENDNTVWCFSESLRCNIHFHFHFVLCNKFGSWQIGFLHNGRICFWKWEALDFSKRLLHERMLLLIWK